jgi:hypothetical protein
MDLFFAWMSRVVNSWKCWIVIAPWDIGVRVRLGRKAVALNPGFHLCIPFVDTITIVNTRMRIGGTPPVTVRGTAVNCTRYISATVGYHVFDPLKAMSKFGLPNAIVLCKAQSEIAATCDEAKAVEAMKAYFDAHSGISIEFIKFVEDVEVKTYRLINGGSWTTSGHEDVSGPGGAISARY